MLPCVWPVADWGAIDPSRQSQSAGLPQDAQTRGDDGRGISLQPPCGEPYRALTLPSLFLAARLAAGLLVQVRPRACTDTAGSRLRTVACFPAYRRLHIFLPLKKKITWMRKKKAVEEAKLGPIGWQVLWVEIKVCVHLIKRQCVCTVERKVECTWCPLHNKTKSSPQISAFHSTLSATRSGCGRVFLFLLQRIHCMCLSVGMI